MGLSIHPGGASWSYSGFMAFRERIAALEPIPPLSDMEGFKKGGVPWSNVEAHTSLVPLLNHSDCDGYLGSWECEQMLPRLQQIHDDDRVWTQDFGGYDRQQLAALIDGMRHSVEYRCAVVFG